MNIKYFKILQKYNRDEPIINDKYVILEKFKISDKFDVYSIQEIHDEKKFLNKIN